MKPFIAHFDICNAIWAAMTNLLTRLAMCIFLQKKCKIFSFPVDMKKSGELFRSHLNLSICGLLVKAGWKYRSYKQVLSVCIKLIHWSSLQCWPCIQCQIELHSSIVRITLILFRFVYIGNPVYKAPAIAGFGRSDVRNLTIRSGWAVSAVWTYDLQVVIEKFHCCTKAHPYISLFLIFFP